MLQTKAIKKDTLSLLKELMDMEILREFNLAGGTALALQLGHRISADLDFFGKVHIDFDVLRTEINSEYDFRVEQFTKNILIGFINEIKVDFVRYKYDLLAAPVIEENIRLLSIQDIGCMKLAAITGRGRKRDFVDLYFILNYFSFSELLSMYQEKYYDGSLQLVLKSISYFEDANKDKDPILFGKTTWVHIKNDIQTQFLKYYESL